MKDMNPEAKPEEPPRQASEEAPPDVAPVAAGEPDASQAAATDSSAPEEPPVQPPPAKTARSPRPASRASFRFLFLLLLAGFGGLGWFSWQQLLQVQALQSRVNGQESRAAALQTRLEALSASNAALQEALQLATGELAVQATESAARLQEVQQQVQMLRLQRNTTTATPADVLLAEARSLLRLGRERLLAGQDVPVALSLYLAADEVLQQINDPAVQLVRQTLLRETDSLRGVRQPDIGSLHAALGDLLDGVNQWPLANRRSEAEQRFVAREETPPAADSGWLGGLQARLSRYFVVTRQEAPVQPLLSEEGMALLRLQMALQLEQARLALLRGDLRLYQQSLDAVAASVSEWVAADEAGVVLARLETLRNSPLQATLPPLGATLNALQELGVR